jgi:hypothetical protein
MLYRLHEFDIASISPPASGESRRKFWKSKGKRQVLTLGNRDNQEKGCPMRKIFLFICCIVLSSTVLANDEPVYSLKEATESEYLEALIEVWGLSSIEFQYQETGAASFAAERLLEYQFLQRFPDFMDENDYLSFEVYAAYYEDDFLSLLYAYSSWNDRENAYFLQHGAQHRDRKRWNEELMVMWLNQSQINLDDYANQELQYFDAETGAVLSNSDEHRFTVIPVDFDNDGQNEWLLRNYHGYYLVIARNEGLYRFVPNFLWWNDDYDTYIYITHDYETIAIEDINGDGVKEWLIWQSANVRDVFGTTGLFIFTWRDNSLDWIFYGDRLPNYVQDVDDWRETEAWSFQNLDEDSALEILVGDTIYDWTGERYIDTNLIGITPTPNPVYEQTPVPLTDFQAGSYAYRQGDFELALDFFDRVVIGEDPLCYATYSQGNERLQAYDDLCLHYWRAITLEALGRNNEALDEYVYLLNGSLARVDLEASYVGLEEILPEFTWYHLASLHLNIDPPIELPSMGQG